MSDIEREFGVPLTSTCKCTKRFYTKSLDSMCEYESLRPRGCEGKVRMNAVMSGANES